MHGWFDVTVILNIWFVFVVVVCVLYWVIINLLRTFDIFIKMVDYFPFTHKRNFIQVPFFYDLIFTVCTYLYVLPILLTENQKEIG